MDWFISWIKLLKYYRSRIDAIPLTRVDAIILEATLNYILYREGTLFYATFVIVKKGQVTYWIS